MTRQTTAQPQLRIDATGCDGVGMCALVAPDLVTLDAWGFPVIADVDGLVASGQITERQARVQARRAVRACPHRVLSD
jgi:ferredoxin